MTTPRPVSHGIARDGRYKRLLNIYRVQLSALIEMERELVDLGFIRPEERRVLSRAERRKEIGRDLG